MSKKILITQSNYIPWKGYFENIYRADVVVIYDDMQYTRRDWRNRNLIKTSNGLKWLSIPVEVKGKYFQKINETKISDINWVTKHLNLLKQNYLKSPHFSEVYEWIESIYNKASNLENLTEINKLFLKEICTFLGITTQFRDSREFDLIDGKTDKLVNICKNLNASEYLSGQAAQNYIDQTKFEEEKIQLTYLSYEGYSEYDQLFSPFEHGVSILDVIFNCGNESRSKVIRK